MGTSFLLFRINFYLSAFLSNYRWFDRTLFSIQLFDRSSWLAYSSCCRRFSRHSCHRHLIGRFRGSCGLIGRLCSSSCGLVGGFVAALLLVEQKPQPFPHLRVVSGHRGSGRSTVPEHLQTINQSIFSQFNKSTKQSINQPNE